MPAVRVVRILQSQAISQETSLGSEFSQGLLCTYAAEGLPFLDLLPVRRRRAIALVLWCRCCCLLLLRARAEVSRDVRLEREPYQATVVHIDP